MVHPTGIEPTTSPRTGRSTTELRTRFSRLETEHALRKATRAGRDINEPEPLSPKGAGWIQEVAHERKYAEMQQ